MDYKTEIIKLINSIKREDVLIHIYYHIKTIIEIISKDKEG